MIDVSIILVTYNSNWESIRITLQSILKQKKVSMQIIIADDGSKITFDEKIKKLMELYGFDNYLIMNSSVNQGTVLNIANAMKNVKGKYTKTISPGDCMFDEITLYNWIKFMSINNTSVSFGDAIYYSRNQKIVIYKTKGSPVNKVLFKSEKYSSKQFVDYIVANDTILGAAQLMKSDILMKYLKIIENKIIYAEDYMIRLMIFDSVNIVYYPNTVIWYEYGTGISTSKNSKWEKLLHTDFEVSNNLIINRKANSFMQKKYKIYLAFREKKVLKKVIKVLLFPSVLIYRFNFRRSKEYIALSTENFTEIEQLFDWVDKGDGLCK